jgi:hypothetical protein
VRVRRALNDNPLVQAVLFGALGLVVVFLLFTRVLGQGSSSEEPATTSEPAPTAAEAAPAEAAASSEVAPVTDPAAAPVDAAAGATAAPPAATAPGVFAKGPGLPGAVVKAYADGKVVALLIVREGGIDDRKVKAMVERLRSRSDTTVFVTPAADIARYSRITRGVDVERVPALVVIKPRRLSEDGTPTATVSYGFRGPESVNQAVRDALYDGRADLPYYPE